MRSNTGINNRPVGTKLILGAKAQPGAASPPGGPGQSPGGRPGGKPPEAP